MGPWPAGAVQEEQGPPWGQSLRQALALTGGQVLLPAWETHPPKSSESWKGPRVRCPCFTEGAEDLDAHAGVSLPHYQGRTRDARVQMTDVSTAHDDPVAWLFPPIKTRLVSS